MRNRAVRRCALSSLRDGAWLCEALWRRARRRNTTRPILPRLTFFLLSVPLLLATAAAAPTDTVPPFDVHPTCGDAAPAAATGERGSDVCVRGELAARDQLTKQWKQFPTGDRARCVQLAAMTHMPSYVEV